MAIAEIVRSAVVGDLRIVKEIGRGSFATVYLAESVNHHGMFYAVKRIKVDAETGAVPPAVASEINVLRRLAGLECVVRLYDHIQTPTHVDLVMEHASTDLFGFICSFGGGVRDAALAKRLIVELVDAVVTCHSFGVFHRDLKPENILVTEDGHLKLCDFGLCTTRMRSMSYGCGSKRYMSPECMGPDVGRRATEYMKTACTHTSSLSARRASFADCDDCYFDDAVPDQQQRVAHDNRASGYDCALNDTWGVAVLIINVLTGRNPWEVSDVARDERFKAFIANPRVLRATFNLNDETANAIASMMHPDPRERMTLKEAHMRFNAIPSVVPLATTKSSHNSALSAVTAAAAAAMPRKSKRVLPPRKSLVDTVPKYNIAQACN